MARGNCQFEGNGGQYFSVVIFHLGLLSMVTLGLYLPWALVRLFKLKASHATIQGERTTFSGTGGQFFVRLLLNGLLTLVTLGFYGPWAFCHIFKWKADHTLVDGAPSRFTGEGGALFILYFLHLVLLPMVTFGFYYLVGMYRFHAWKEEHTLYGGKFTSFGAGLGEYVKICLLTWILNSITFALFTPWSLCMLYRWQMKGLVVGDKDLVDHFPPVQTSWRAVIITFLMGLLLFASAGFFILEEIKFHIQAFSEGSFKETGILKSKIIKNRSKTPPPLEASKRPVKVQKPTAFSVPQKKETLGASAPPKKISPKQPQMDNGAFDKEIESLNLFIKENPENGIAFYNRAGLYASKGDLDEALKDYSEAIRLNSNNADAYYNRGMVRVRLKDFDLALKDFNKAITLRPTFEDAYCNKGNTHYALEKYSFAIQDYTKALEMDAGDGDVYYNRGLAYLALGQKEQALSDFKKASQLGQKKAEEYLQ